MTYGVRAAIFWAAETLLLNQAMAAGYLAGISAIQAALLAAALHDCLSAGYLLLYLSRNQQIRTLGKAICSPGGRNVMLAALLGGPVGMSCYLLAIQLSGASTATSVSAVYPAIGAGLAFLFLKERLHGYQLAGLFLCVGGTVILGIRAGEQRNAAGFLFAVLCAISWGSEAVISSGGMEKSHIPEEFAMTIRQITSAAVYMLVICPLANVSRMIPDTIGSLSFAVLLLGACAGTMSYLFYYKAIRRIGPSKAMACNITYTVWVLLFEAVLLRSIPDARLMLCAVMIAAGAALAAYETNEIKKKRS